MDQVIQNGETDAMREIQECRKEITVLNNKSKIMDKQMEVQKENEDCIQKNTIEMEKKIKDLENKAKSQGINIEQLDEDKLFLQVRDPKLIELRKKIIERNAINSIEKKFYTKFNTQKEKLEQILLGYNEFLDTLNSRPDKQSIESNIRDLIDINSNLLYNEITKQLDELKRSLPTISTRLPWQTGLFFKPRSTSNSRSKAYLKTNKVTFGNKYPNNHLKSKLDDKN
jgi:hypothetical protein